MWKKLDQAKHRRQEGLFLAEGKKVVRDLMNSDWTCRAILVTQKSAACLNDFLCIVPEGMEFYQLTETEWGKLSQDKTPEEIIAVVAIPRGSEIDALQVLDEPGHLLLLYRVNNPNNLGAVIRTAHWFGIKKIMLSSGSVDFTNAKVVRTAMGSLFHTTLISGVDFMQIMPKVKAKYLLVGSTNKSGARPHSGIQKIALMLGSESHGIPDSLLGTVDELWHIPGTEGADSLSLPQAAAIMMYECTKREST